MQNQWSHFWIEVLFILPILSHLNLFFSGQNPVGNPVDQITMPVLPAGASPQQLRAAVEAFIQANFPAGPLQAEVSESLDVSRYPGYPSPNSASGNPSNTVNMSNSVVDPPIPPVDPLDHANQASRLDQPPKSNKTGEVDENSSVN